jgi:plasmid stability protein
VEGAVPDVTIRRIDDETIKILKVRAKLNHRTVESEMREILLQAACPGRVDPRRKKAIQWLKEFRKSYKGPYEGDIVAEIRADRDRR